jgi:predicted Zn-dependent protease
MKPFSSGWIVAAALALSGCYTVPETGRQAFILPLFDDVQMGAQAFAEIRAKERVSTDAAQHARVQRVGRRIAEAVGDRMPGAQWEFVVFEAPGTVNAFALPGGKVGVYSGLLKLAATDDELAFVLGHEIAHVTSRHSAQRATAALGAAVGGLVVDSTTKDSKNREIWLAAYGVAAAGGTLAYSRMHESESDLIGLRFSAHAGYDPRAAVTFWRKMADASAGSAKPPEFLSTHPSDDRRIADLQAQFPQVLPIYEANRGRFGN